jgi:hypothetical protein
MSREAKRAIPESAQLAVEKTAAKTSKVNNVCKAQSGNDAPPDDAMTGLDF